MSYQSWAYDKMQSEKETNKWIGAETEKDVGSIVLFHGHAVCIISQWARGPWESPASCCGFFRHNSHRLLKGFYLKQNHGGEIGAHHKMMLRCVQMNQRASHSADLVLGEKKRQAGLEETKAQLFVIIDLFELAWALPFPSFTFRFSSQNNNTFCQ